MFTKKVSVFFQAIAEDFNTGAELSKLEDFVTSHEDELGPATRAAQQAIENARLAHFSPIVDHFKVPLTRGTDRVMRYSCLIFPEQCLA